MCYEHIRPGESSFDTIKRCKGLPHSMAALGALRQVQGGLDENEPFSNSNTDVW